MYEFLQYINKKENISLKCSPFCQVENILLNILYINLHKNAIEKCTKNEKNIKKPKNPYKTP
jgi:hypothetical protein